MAPVVHLRDLVSVLGRFPALAGVDLDVHPGEVVLLRGPNGAGKTTILRTCAGLARVARGTARVLDIDVARDPVAVRRRVGMLAHQTGLYDDLSATDNVRFWARAAGATVADADAALDLLSLTGPIAAMPVERLSQGQRRRVSLACVVARRPEVWLLDEPHAGLDQEWRDHLDGLVRDAAAAGAAVLVASHELDRAAAIASRVVSLDRGVVVADRPAREPARVP